MDFKGHRLQFVGFGLSICHEGADVGHGLMANLHITMHDPVTQYEGVLISKTKAEAIRKGTNGKALGSHFATTSSRQMVINGYSFKAPTRADIPYPHGGIPLSQEEWHGRGGGSLCNHSGDCNAELVRDSEGDGYGIFVIALRDIQPGGFIHVDYGKRFIQSSKSNI